jgi:hypothetical protein
LRKRETPWRCVEIGGGRMRNVPGGRGSERIENERFRRWISDGGGGGGGKVVSRRSDYGRIEEWIDWRNERRTRRREGRRNASGSAKVPTRSRNYGGGTCDIVRRVNPRRRMLIERKLLEDGVDLADVGI